MQESIIKERAMALADWVTEARRGLHAIPELGFEEAKTQAYICGKLEEIGIPYVTERTWVIGTIEGGQPGKTVALRADIDALPIAEETGLAFASGHEGKMHACGHDAHAAMLLGAAKLLWAMREELPGTVRLLFQPAEETSGGAEPMISAGALENVDVIYGMHVAAQAPVGRVASRPGAMYAASDMFTMSVLGRSGHGAHPRSGVDAIVIAAQIITAIQTLVTRETEATENAIITIGSIHGGSACNILCDEVRLFGTMRSLTPLLREQLCNRLTQLAQGIARAMGGDVRVEINNGYPACINDPNESARVLSVAERMLGASHTKQLQESSMGAEDFAFYLQHVPGAMFHLGCGSEAPLHSEHFILDEACLPIGVAMHTALAFDYLGNRPEKRKRRSDHQ